MAKKKTPAGPFSNGKTHINVRTVAQCIAELQKLPPDLLVHQGFENSVDLVWFNRNMPELASPSHLSFEEGGFWDEDARE